MMRWMLAFGVFCESLALILEHKYAEAVNGAALIIVIFNCKFKGED